MSTEAPLSVSVKQQQQQPTNPATALPATKKSPVITVPKVEEVEPEVLNVGFF